MQNGSRLLLYTIAFLLPLAGCATWTTGSTTPTSIAAANQPRDPAAVIVTENDITTRPYTVVGDIKVSVHKTTIFNSDPTREQVNEAMQSEAAKLGADAVVLARYGTVGIDPLSWGRLDGNGRAVRFTE
jgi:uncharacterized protein YbjQ (UPF0145 family)